jgi:hypothetical protein
MPTSDAPLLLAWRKGSTLDVRIAGDEPNRVGEGLFMIPLAMTLDSQQVLGDQVMQRTIVETTSDQAWGEGGNYYLSRGTMTIETRPMGLSGAFTPSSLEVAITQGEVRPLTGRGKALAPLPDAEQPDQEDPVGDGVNEPIPSEGGGGAPNDGGPKPAPPDVFRSMLPAFQLFDRVDQRWVEFPQPETSSSYLIDDPQRYVDDGGGVLFRFVNRAEANEFGEEQVYFNLLMRLEGTLA